MSCPVVAPGFVAPPRNHDTAIGPRRPAAANRLGKGVMTRCAMRLNRPAKVGRCPERGVCLRSQAPGTSGCGEGGCARLTRPGPEARRVPSQDLRDTNREIERSW